MYMQACIESWICTWRGSVTAGVVEIRCVLASTDAVCKNVCLGLSGLSNLRTVLLLGSLNSRGDDVLLKCLAALQHLKQVDIKRGTDAVVKAVAQLLPAAPSIRTVNVECVEAAGIGREAAEAVLKALQNAAFMRCLAAQCRKAVASV